MSAEIILPACHHFNAEPALQKCRQLFSRARQLGQRVLRNPRLDLPPEIIFEHSLVNRTDAEYGPDLGFIEIANCERLSSVKAIASVWPLNRDPKVLLKEFGTVGCLLASVGYPEERCQTEVTGYSFRRVSYHLTCPHVI